MNQSNTCVNAPYATLKRAYGVRSAIIQNNAHLLLLHILSILNSDWLQHVLGVRGVYECKIKHHLMEFYHLCNFKLENSQIREQPKHNAIRDICEVVKVRC